MVLNELLTNKDLDRLGFGGTVKLWKLRKEGKLPFLRFGRKIFYDPAEIAALMQISGKSNTIQEVKA